jgi:hypothetical protein
MYTNTEAALSLYSRAGSRCEGQLKCADDGRDRTALIFKRSNRKRKKKKMKRPVRVGPFVSGAYTHSSSAAHSSTSYTYTPRRKGWTTNNPLRSRASLRAGSSFSRRKTSNLSSRQAPNFWTLNLTDIRSHGRSPLKKKELLFYYIL